jgi:transposase
MRTYLIHRPARDIICEAVTRANMRFVEPKTPEQQMLHRTRYLFIRQQTAVINVVRALLDSWGKALRP